MTYGDFKSEMMDPNAKGRWMASLRLMGKDRLIQSLEECVELMLESLCENERLEQEIKAIKVDQVNCKDE